MSEQRGKNMSWFSGDSNEPGGGVLGSKVTATICSQSGKLAKGEQVKVVGNPTATNDQFKAAKANASSMGYNLTKDGGSYYLKKK